MKILHVLISMLLLIAGLTGSLSAQPQYYNYNTNGSNNSFPFNIAAGKQVQLLYLPGDFNQPSAAPAGNITSVAFRMGDTYPLGPWTYTDFTIKMGQSTITSLPASGYYTPLTTVYYRASVVLQAAGATWLTITLDAPFPYNPTQSLIVDVGQCGAPGAAGFSACFTAGTGNRRNWSVGGCPFAWSNINTSIYHFGVNISGGGPTTGTLSGTVTNASTSAPIAGATISVGALNTTSIANGTYTLTNVPVGVQTAICSATGYITQNQTVTMVAGQTTTRNFAMVPIAAILSGVITSATTGNPIVGASVQVGTQAPVLSTGPNGAYTANISPVGTFNITITKAGFDNFTAGPITFTTGTTTLNAAMLENTNAPANVVAALNTGQTAVNISWNTPNGNYELLYDDGQEESFIVWETAGNFNGVKFTPVAYPATVNGGKINIGAQSRYPSGSNPLVPMQILVFDATGPNGTPGTQIGGPFDFTPTIYGWNTFTFGTPVTITSGNFYIVQKQGGNYPNAAGVAIDTTTSNLRSYQKFVTGNGPWVPASGNFMIRALMFGAGGPVPLLDGPQNTITASGDDHAKFAYKPSTITGVEGKGQVIWLDETDNTETITGYQVWRLLQGQEATPASWTSIGTPTAPSIVDNSWPTLPCNAYRWAVQTHYTGNRWSSSAFSNVLGKCWTAAVTINVDLTCLAANAAYSIVKLQNLVYTDTVYQKQLDSTQTCVFPTVWKGTYTLTVVKFGYTQFTQTPITIMGNMTIDVMLMQQKTPPSNLQIDDRSLHATWSPPRVAVPVFTETWASGSLATNGWTTSGGANWMMSAGFGNPAPSVMFNWTPQVTAYNQYLTSKNLAGLHSPSLKLKYDIYLSNFGTTNENTMAVELWNGTTWTVLKSYTNQGGNIAWTPEELDIASVTHNPAFRIRFHAAGADSYDINNWNIDNISIVASETTSGPNLCVLGYNFYLNNVISGFTLDTTYTIPATQVVYGQVYQGCVNAVYGAGYSTKICKTFTAHFLYPPTMLAVTGVEDAAYLTWHKPVIAGDGPQVLDVQARETTTNSAGAELSPMSIITTTPNYTDNIWDVLFTWNSSAAGCPGIENNATEIFTAQWSTPTPTWFHRYNKMTGALLEDFDIAGATAIRDMASHTSLWPMYYGGAGAAALYKMNMTTKTLVSTIATGVSGGIRHIAYDPGLDGGAGGFWCGNWTDIFAIKMNGTVLYPGGIAPNNAYGSAYDDMSTGGPYLWLYTQSGANTQDLIQYKINPTAPYLVATGVTHNSGTLPGAAAGTAGGLCFGQVNQKAALIGNIQLSPNMVFAYELAAWSGGGGGTPVGLIGYKIYRSQGGTTGPWALAKTMIPGPDSLSWYDFHLNPGKWCYRVTAVYDLTTYGFPGQQDQSLPEGPQCVTLNYGRQLPFCEDWIGGTFGFNNWQYSATGQGNWTLNTGVGNAAPSEDFSWQPIKTNYSYGIESPVIDASPWTCAEIWLDFDYKLVDRNMTSAEKLTVEVYYSNSWHQKDEFVNNGNVDWTTRHIDISSAKGRAFKVRFTASGANSADILHWYVDNICMYGICTPPSALAATQSGFNTTLTWTAPECGSSGGNLMWFIFDDGSMENGWSINPGFEAWIGNEFPIASTTQGVIQMVKFMFWTNASAGNDQLTIDFFDASHTLLGSTNAFTPPDDAWDSIAVNDIPFAGMFYALVHWNMAGAVTNYIGYDENGPYAAQDLETYYDGTTWSKLSIAVPTNPGVCLVRVLAMVNGDMKTVEIVPGQPVTGTANASGLSNHGAGHFESGDHQEMGVLLDNQSDSSTMMGYNVYRTAGTAGTGAFGMINAAPVPGTTYVDTHPANTEPGAVFKYYVTDVFNNSVTGLQLCESPSDTITVNWPAVGINNLGGGEISIYPNPARDLVNIVSSSTIKSVEMMNFIGQSVYNSTVINNKSMQVNVSAFAPGVYFVKITTDQGTRTTKITVTK